jgi:hypothetical protein
VNEARATIARRSSTLIGRCQCCRNPWYAMQLPCVVQIFLGKDFMRTRGIRTTLKPLRPASCEIVHDLQAKVQITIAQAVPPERAI